MLSWVRRQRDKIERIEAEADTLIHNLGVGAYSAARRRAHEAGSEAMARDWRRIALAVAHKTGAWASILQPVWRGTLTSRPRAVPRPRLAAGAYRYRSAGRAWPACARRPDPFCSHAQPPHTSRKLRVKRRYNQTACRMMSAGNWWRANEIVVIRHRSRRSGTRQSSRVSSEERTGFLFQEERVCTHAWGSQKRGPAHP
jgi:hypothetical protein